MPFNSSNFDSFSVHFSKRHRGQLAFQELNKWTLLTTKVIRSQLTTNPVVLFCPPEAIWLLAQDRGWLHSDNAYPHLSWPQSVSESQLIPKSSKMWAALQYGPEKPLPIILQRTQPHYDEVLSYSRDKHWWEQKRRNCPRSSFMLCFPICSYWFSPLLSIKLILNPLKAATL